MIINIIHECWAKTSEWQRLFVVSLQIILHSFAPFYVVPIRCRAMCIRCTSTSSVLIRTASLYIANNSFICRCVSYMRCNSLCFVLHRDNFTWYAAKLSEIVFVNRCDSSLFVPRKSKQYFQHHWWRNSSWQLALIRCSSPKKIVTVWPRLY